MNRRSFLLGLGVLGSSMMISGCQAAFIPTDRTLKLYSTRTKERISVTYFSNGRYRRNEIKRIFWLLRDDRSRKVSRPNIKLLNYLWSINYRLSRGASTICITSGYRTERTQKILKNKGYKVAKNSQHLYGDAIDFYVPGHSIRAVYNAAKASQMGGIGYYPKRGYVHIDTGPVREW